MSVESKANEQKNPATRSVTDFEKNLLVNTLDKIVERLEEVLHRNIHVGNMIRDSNTSLIHHIGKTIL